MLAASGEIKLGKSTWCMHALWASCLAASMLQSHEKGGSLEHKNKSSTPSTTTVHSRASPPRHRLSAPQPAAAAQPHGPQLCCPTGGLDLVTRLKAAAGGPCGRCARMPWSRCPSRRERSLLGASAPVAVHAAGAAGGTAGAHRRGLARLWFQLQPGARGRRNQ